MASHPDAPDARVLEVAAAYTDDAASYQIHWAHILLGPAERLLDALELAHARRVIDVGAGVGALLPAISRRAPQATVIAVDRSEGMLRLAAPVYQRALMDGATLGLLPMACDAALLVFVLFHFPEPAPALHEARRVLHPGGKLGLTTWGPMSDSPALTVVKEELDRHGAPELGGVLARHELMDEPGKVEALLRSAGFDDIRVWSTPLDHRPDPEAFLKRFALRSLRRRLAALPEPTRAACLAATRARVLSLGSDALLDRTPVIYATARRPLDVREAPGRLP